MIDLDKALLVRGGFSTMWQGSKEIRSNQRVSIATGLQASPLPRGQKAVEYLLQVVLTARAKAPLNPSMDSCSENVGSCFDYFSMASFEGEKSELILVTDALSLSPIYWLGSPEFLVFSSRQTFLRIFLGESFEPDLQAAMEYLVIGHLLGSKSLIRGVELLAPGSMLTYRQGRISIKRYVDLALGSPQSITLEEAVGRVLEFLRSKVNSYFQLNGNTAVASFLSGGWDSRLLAALIKEAGRLEVTFTTQQQVRLQGRLISEKAIAKEVSQLLGVENRFILPQYRSPQNRVKRAALLDYTTWFHDWAFSMTQHVPTAKYLLADGLLGDILLRGLYVFQELEESQQKGMERCAEIFTRLYLEGFNPYTR
ncbi:MAG TPA: hypothetical protein EYP06_01305, partial [Desulfobacterales bacterium]|nr:hypothetical protein [Desulfobacterales bacterium]